MSRGCSGKILTATAGVTREPGVTKEAIMIVAYSRPLGGPGALRLGMVLA